MSSFIFIMYFCILKSYVYDYKFDPVYGKLDLYPCMGCNLKCLYYCYCEEFCSTHGNVIKYTVRLSSPLFENLKIIRSIMIKFVLVAMQYAVDKFVFNACHLAVI